MSSDKKQVSPFGFSGRVVLTVGKRGEKDESRKVKVQMPVPATAQEFGAVLVKMGEKMLERARVHFIRGWRIWWQDAYCRDKMVELGKDAALAHFDKVFSDEAEMTAIMFDPSRRPGRPTQPKTVKVNKGESIEDALKRMGIQIQVVEN